MQKKSIITDRYKLPLTDNFLFKALFSQHEDMLLDLLNSFPEFQNEKKILKLTVLNPELPKAADLDKLSILDIHAEDSLKNKFLIEMQAGKQESFEKRILFYWSKIYAKSLKRGNKYNFLPKVYSINFLGFEFLPIPKIHSIFQLREKDNPEILLTNDLEIHIIELPKLKSLLANLKTDFESWMFALKYGHTLKGDEMNTLTKKNPKLKKVFQEYKEYTSNPKNKYLIEARQKSALDLKGQLSYAKKEGKLETAIGFLNAGSPMQAVVKVTGLSEKEILDYRKSLEKKNTTSTR